jgi:hypothetical protein
MSEREDRPPSRWLSEEVYRRSRFVSRAWATIQARAAATWRGSLVGARAVVRVRSTFGSSRGEELEMPIEAAAAAVRGGAVERVPGVTYPRDFPWGPRAW